MAPCTHTNLQAWSRQGRREGQGRCKHARKEQTCLTERAGNTPSDAVRGSSAAIRVTPLCCPAHHQQSPAREHSGIVDLSRQWTSTHLMGHRTFFASAPCHLQNHPMGASIKIPQCRAGTWCAPTTHLNNRLNPWAFLHLPADRAAVKVGADLQTTLPHGISLHRWHSCISRGNI